MKTKIKIHDGIVGILVLGSVVLAVKVSAQWLWVAGGVGALLVFSAFSGFCPVYFILNKLMPNGESK